VKSFLVAQIHATTLVISLTCQSQDKATGNSPWIGKKKEENC
jgi:hypothetical protein